MNKWMLAIALSAITGVAYGGDLCAVNPYTRGEADLGKVEFDSHCALCHQYSMTGREPGNYQNESPDINLLSASDLKFLDGGGGTVPPLIGAKFFKKQQGLTLTEFSTKVGGAANTFPTKNFQSPRTYFLIAAYVLYRNCGKM
jgi:hypothetical protein